ncbi:MAG: hypothetical protein CYPHOPRED_000665 [Cyphobasidiales sp. Tagirdzhanova-0007]|nr:MAG: hypothetical protein CYPHOPRED_000665 [Cyphobasidiales sp. Tagirdzhanova-0007]
MSTLASVRPLRSLSELFSSLPTEGQRNVLQELDSRMHLLALSLSSRLLHALCADSLHSSIVFDALTPSENIQSYLTYTLPQHGMRCRSLKIDFSLGPCIIRSADRHRSKLLAQVLRGARTGLKYLEINTAGSKLCDTSETLQAVLCASLQSLRSLSLKIIEVEDDEIDTIAAFLYQCSRRPNDLPSLRSLSFEGYWVLASSSEVASIFHNLRLAITALPKLRELRFAYLTVSTDDLTFLLQDARLQSLVLHEIEGLSLSDCLDALAATESLRTLQSFTFIFDTTSTPACTLDLYTKRLSFLNLRKLSLGLQAHVSESRSIRLLSCLLQTNMTLVFPVLTTIETFHATSCSDDTSIIAWTIMHARKPIKMVSRQLGVINFDATEILLEPDIQAKHEETERLLRRSVPRNEGRGDVDPDNAKLAEMQESLARLAT